MAEDVAAGSAVRPAAELPATSRSERTRSSAYYTRFSLAFMLLIFLAVGAVGALVIVLTHSQAKRGPAWSTFKPSGPAISMERQIATQVSSEYKASTSTGLVTVFPSPLTVTQFAQTNSGPQSLEVQVSQLAVQPNVSTGQHQEGDFTFFDPASTVAYEMCGFGDPQKSCGVATTGKSPAGLLRREALELSLYTLKYVPGTNAVITYLPPRGASLTATRAVFIARKDVKRNLQLPLTRTLKPQQVVLGAGVPDGGHVGELTSSHVYSTDSQSLPGGGTAALLLTPTSG